MFIAAAIGLTAGVFSGLLGIGGGIIMIPALVFFMGYSQHLAQGTTFAAMVLPIGLLAAAEYYKQGNVNITSAVIIAVSFVLGGFFGAKIALIADASVLKKIFAVFLIAIGIRMLISR